MNQEDEKKIMDDAVRQVAGMDQSELKAVARSNFEKIKSVGLSRDPDKQNQLIRAGYPTLVNSYALMGAALAQLGQGLTPLSDKVGAEQNYAILVKYHMAVLRYSTKPESGLRSGDSPFYGHLQMSDVVNAVPQITMLPNLLERRRITANEHSVVSIVKNGFGVLAEMARDKFARPRGAAAVVGEVPAASLKTGMSHE